MPEVRQSFLGIPVTGNIQDAGKRVAQRPLEDLATFMQALLDDPTIGSFSWVQYTPYFNDGDPCVFNVHEALSVTIASPGDTLSDGTAVCPDDSCGTVIPAGNEYCGKCGTWVRDLDEDDDDAGTENGVEYSPHLGKRVSKWDSESKKYAPGTYLGPDEARYDRCLALEKALGSGAFDDVLLEHFGDHCSVRVSRNGIRVSEYSHD